MLEKTSFHALVQTKVLSSGVHSESKDEVTMCDFPSKEYGQKVVAVRGCGKLWLS